jgi:aldehyde dehydrogenase (NAD+)
MTTTAPLQGTLGEAMPYIDGTWLTSTSGGTMDKIDPRNGRVQGLIHLAGADEVDQAVAAAAAAFPAWRDLPGGERRKVLLRLERIIEEHAEEFGRIAALEGGANRALSTGGHLVAASWFGYYAGWADKIEGVVVPGVPGGFDYTVAEPYGVVGVIITWNGPMISVGMKVAPALAAGNTVVLKSPELAPFAIQRFGELIQDAGLPPGVLNIVPGARIGREVGQSGLPGRRSRPSRVVRGGFHHRHAVRAGLRVADPDDRASRDLRRGGGAVACRGGGDTGR